jgi:hypothetical protein
VTADRDSLMAELDQHLDLARDWTDGLRSTTNTMIGVSSPENRAAVLAEIERADTAIAARHINYAQLLMSQVQFLDATEEREWRIRAQTEALEAFVGEATA